jgi:hypothetical protein
MNKRERRDILAFIARDGFGDLAAICRPMLQKMGTDDRQ